MISALYAYAKAHGLGDSPWQKHAINYRLVLGASGARLEPYKGPKLEVLTEARSNGDKPFHLFDTEEYVLGLPMDSTPKAGTRARERHEKFWERVERVLTEAGATQALEAVQTLRAQPGWGKQVQLSVPPQGHKPKPIKGWIALAIEGDDGFLLEHPQVRRQDQIAFDNQITEGPDRCVITGKPCRHVRLHDRIKGVPGTEGAVAFVSFKAKTAEFQGRHQGDNLHMSHEAMKGYVAALNHLLERSTAVIGKHTCLALWGPSDASKIAAVIHKYTKTSQLEAAWEALSSSSDSDEPLHILGLSGSKGRIAVLSYDVIRTGDAVAALKTFHSYATRKYVPTVMQLIPERASKSLVPETLCLGVVRNLLLSKDLPPSFMQILLRELRPRDIISNATPTMHWLDFNHNHPDRPDMDVSKEPVLTDYCPHDHDGNAYHLGRLIALLVQMKYQAHRGGFSSNIEQTLLTLAQSCPSRFFREAGRQYPIVASKVSAHMKDLWADTCIRITPDFASSIKPIGLSQQGVMSLGYHQQAAYNRHLSKYRKLQRDKKSEATTNEPAEG